MTLDDMTAVCVDTRDPNLALLAAHRMLAAGVSHVIMITDEAGADFIRPRRGMGGIDLVLIPALTNSHEYSHFMLKDIGRFIKDEHFIVFQWDGFIINPSLWWEGFLEYDYIGAPWAESHGPDALVGNGGFSLRSSKLLDAIGKLDLPAGELVEDRFIADHGRHLSDIGDVSIAPPEIARHFSIEHHPPYTMENPRRLVARNGAFGFHGWFNFYLAFDDEGFLDYIDRDMTEVQRRRILTSWAHFCLLHYLKHANRIDCLIQILIRTETALGVILDRSDPWYLQKVMDLILAN
jgi:hypothetical protein